MRSPRISRTRPNSAISRVRSGSCRRLLREALVLVGAQELTYEEAAAICCVPVGTMKARVSRARRQLARLADRSTAARRPE